MKSIQLLSKLAKVPTSRLGFRAFRYASIISRHTQFTLTPKYHFSSKK